MGEQRIIRVTPISALHEPRGEVGTMCFRPSAVDHDRDIQQTTCPTCGMPVAAEAGTTSGTCPYCGDPIPPDSPDGFGNTDPSHDVRIL